MSQLGATPSPKVVSREDWLVARKALLDKEKELTRANDALSAQRRALPMVRVDNQYTFSSLAGESLTLVDLFEGKDQLIVYHFMFGPETEQGCRACSHIGESLPDLRHLRLKNTNLVGVSRAPPNKLEAFRALNGWTWPWYSSQGSDFNYDFHATMDESKRPMELNFSTKEEIQARGKSWYSGDVPGFSVFYKRGGDVFHTYSTFARGVDKMIPTLQLLDMTPLGRQIGPQGPAEFMPKHEYDKMADAFRSVDKALPGNHTRMLYDTLKRKEANVLSQLRTGMTRLNGYLFKIGQ